MAGRKKRAGKSFVRLLVLLTALAAWLPCLAGSHALLVGIGDYDKAATGWGRIHGHLDVAMLREDLTENGFPQSNIATLVNEKATKKAIVRALTSLAERCRPGDTVLFHFSGHGQPVTDVNGDEKEGDGFDESIIPYDACRSTRYSVGGVRYDGCKHLIDDELNPLLERIRQKLGKRGYLVVTVDACFSRGIEMDGVESMGVTLEEARRLGKTRGTDDKFIIRGGVKRPKPKGYGPGGARMAVITACREDERNFQYKVPGTDKEYGSLSYTLHLLLKRGKKLREWEAYFADRQYGADGVFTSVQHPKVVVYK